MILKIAAVSSIIGVILNIVLAYVLFPFATPEQIKPPNGAQNLPFMSQFMHMIVHHKQVLFTSFATKLNRQALDIFIVTTTAFAIIKNIANDVKVFVCFDTHTKSSQNSID